MNDAIAGIGKALDQQYAYINAQSPLTIPKGTASGCGTGSGGNVYTVESAPCSIQSRDPVYEVITISLPTPGSGTPS